MIDNNRRKIAHAERIALHFCFVQKLGRTMTAVGRPEASSLMPSCIQHDVHGAGGRCRP
jgi:hypothetical protein